MKAFLVLFLLLAGCASPKEGTKIVKSNNKYIIKKGSSIWVAEACELDGQRFLIVSPVHP